MRKRLFTKSIAALAMAFPMAAWADFSNTQTLSSGQYLTLENGTASSSAGGDFQFTGTTITPQGTAQFSDQGPSGQAIFGILTGTTLPFLTYTSAPIKGTSLAANDVFAVKTIAGHYAKVLIVSVSSSSLQIQYVTYGAAAGGNTPTITAVQDAGGYTSNVAQGSVFVVKGSNLSAAGIVQTSFPLPPSMGGVSITFTPLTGGTGTPALIVYLYNENGVNQLAAVLPSTVAPGSYNVTVTNGSATSAGFQATVVKQKPALITADSTGSGLAVMQNYISASQVDVNRFTSGSAFGSTISPAHPGQTEIAYLVGMGPDPGPDNQASPGYNFLTNGVTVQVLVGGSTITPGYAGRVPGGSGYEQVNFTLPANVQTGCTIPFQISENGILSQQTFIAIAPAGSNACVQPGYTSSQLQQFDNGSTINAGTFSLSQISETVSGLGSFTQATAGGGFTQYTGAELAAIPANVSTGAFPSGCSVTLLPQPAVTATSVFGSGIALDAGRVTLSGPAASNLNNTALTDTSGLYSLTINGQGSPVNGNLVAGTYTLNGAGGAGVGAFKATLTLGPPLTITGGLPTVVNRSSGLTINWTGGNASDAVIVEGTSETLVNNVTTGALFICYTTAGAGSINIGSSILNQLPAISSGAIANGTGSTSLAVYSGTTPSASNGLFSAPLTAGGTITNAYFIGSVGTGTTPSFQ